MLFARCLFYVIVIVMSVGKLSPKDTPPRPGKQLVGEGVNREFRIFMSQKVAAQSLTGMYEGYTSLNDLSKTQLIEFTGMAVAAGLLASLESRTSKKYTAHTVEQVNKIYDVRQVPKTSRVRDLVPVLIDAGYVLHGRLLLHNPKDSVLDAWNSEFIMWRGLQQSMKPPQDWAVFRRHDVPRL